MPCVLHSTSTRQLEQRSIFKVTKEYISWFGIGNEEIKKKCRPTVVCYSFLFIQDDNMNASIASLKSSQRLGTW